ncbi:MAG TPA: hypothetical protein VKA65_00220 [Acidimicrobiales bacterium]|nr:hypothetical protein [Acidimicrobiales bacterium]
MRTDRRPGAARAGVVLAALALALGVALGLAACGGGGDAGDDGLADRQQEVAERGEGVMPFDLEATTHRFEPTADGLVQTVVADDPSDAANVSLVREHLTDEAERFAAGDYDDPAAIHGEEMPGLAELEAGADRIDVAYAEADAGGRITYTTADATLVDALHRWAEAQVMDHGTHADPGRTDPTA